MKFKVRVLLLVPLLLSLFLCAQAAAEDVFERPPISYSTAIPHDAISLLKRRLASGKIRLEGDEKQFVRGLLSALDVPEESQMLVIRRTRGRFIFPTTCMWAGVPADSWK